MGFPALPKKKLNLFLNTAFLCLLLPLFTNVLNPPKPPSTSLTLLPSKNPTFDSCAALHQYADYASKCAYVKSHSACWAKGYISYLQIFYCSCGRLPVLGFAILLLWLVLFFYLLGDTASEYFCPSLASLCKILNLSPTIAGTTLLPLGNGVTDLFASVISFTRSGDGDVGLNSVLGGAFFISSVVVGVISISIAPHEISVDKYSFLRDVVFFLFALSYLLFIVIIGKITLWGAICFVCLYFVYIIVVCVMQLFYGKKQKVVNLSRDPEFGAIGVPLLGCVDEEKPVSPETSAAAAAAEGLDQAGRKGLSSFDFVWFLRVMEMPLYLPRRLTIPLLREEKWSKPFAVMSVTLAPILLASLWNTQRPNLSSSVIYLASGVVGVVLGSLAIWGTSMSGPPKKCLLPWLAGGFLMSITWTYIIAEELVSLLVAFGYILGISPAILGVTVLAWGNSTGDLMANVAVAMNGGSDGVQIAISGSYAGPLFNTLVGLGVSLVFASCSQYPASFVIPTDPYLVETLGFLMAGLLWALVILPKKNMRLDKSLGVGLLAIYSCFLFLRLARALGFLNLDG